MELNPRLIKETFSYVERHSDEAIGYFYGRLFAEYPRLRQLFPPALDVQRDRLFAALTRVVFSLDNPESLSTYLAALGRDHRKFGVTAEHFEAVGKALIVTLCKYAGTAWSAEAEAAWAAAYAEAADMMIKASEAEDTPPWWDAQVVEHELRRPDIAVVTLRPGQPLPYEPGQYVSVQTTRWPRVWRTFSIANAPRPDHLLRLHVRALPGGWVSGTLANHTKPGDTVLLGAARGSMVLDAASGGDLLCVAGGTGLAPIKALVEQVVRSGRRRGVQLFVAARTQADLYDMPDLERLRASYPWLDIRPVVSAGPGEDGQDSLVSTLREQAGAPGGDAYVCGPEPMTRAITTLLRELGVPPARIHHDLGGF
ncbi:MAG: flavohemoprotein [Streptosporangiales bacterium]|nr:flavohemoprotein [Streptosporangiales bacterium]